MRKHIFSYFTIIMYIALKKERWHSAISQCCLLENSRKKSITREFSAADREKSSFMAVNCSFSIWILELTSRSLNCKLSNTRTVSNLRCPTTPPLAESFLTFCLDISIDRREIKSLIRTIFCFSILTNMVTSITMKT